MVSAILSLNFSRTTTLYIELQSIISIVVKFVISLDLLLDKNSDYLVASNIEKRSIKEKLFSPPGEPLCLSTIPLIK